MSMYTSLKKYAKRKAGCWGRINHKRDMRAASKAVRKYASHEDKWDEYHYPTLEELLAEDQIYDEEHIDEEPH